MQRASITIPAAVITEWRRGTVRQASILEAFDIEPMTERIAKIAGDQFASAAVRVKTGAPRTRQEALNLTQVDLAHLINRCRAASPTCC